MSRILTKPLRERFGELRGITGATMEDGTVYRARRDGRMDVERADHVAAMKRDERAREDLVFGTSMPKADMWRVCMTCSWSAWWWQEECPRCGGATAQVSAREMISTENEGTGNDD